MVASALAARLRRHEAVSWAVLAAFMAFYYGLVLTDGHFNLFHPTVFGRTFNSMLTQMAAGQFDVDPAAVGLEGFSRDGRTYAYWGIFCALIRLPMLVIPGGVDTDVTGLSCFLAVWTGACAKLATLRMVHRAAPAGPAADTCFALLLVAIVLGSAQTGFLRVSIYQEVVFWAGTLGAIFVGLAVRHLLRGPEAPVGLAAMALIAGLALLTRVSTGLGLCLALCLLIGARLASRHRRGVVLPVGILLVFVVITATVNQMRWGNPLTFAEYSIYNYNIRYPDRPQRLREYGLFNLARLPFALLYFFAPVWAVRGLDGSLILDRHRDRLLDAAELPPSSLLLSDPLVFVMSGFLAVALLRQRWPAARLRLPVAALAAGLAAPPALMLVAMNMAYRYRIEFYPLLDMLSFLGLLAIAHNAALGGAFLRHTRAIATATLAGIAVAHVTCLLYKVSELGPAELVIGDDLLHYYRLRLAAFFLG